MKLQTLNKNVAALLVIGAATASGANLVTNGDFELGNIGFTSDYVYNASAAALPASANLDLAQYVVGTNPANYHSAGASYGDYPTGTGNMAVFNGSSDANDIAWQSSAITVDPGTDYSFEAWASNWTAAPGLGSQLSFEIRDAGGSWVVLGTIGFDGATAGNWVSVSQIWNSGSSTSTEMRVTNTQISFNGNDFALDSISLSQVPEPSAVTLLGAVGVAGLIRRRRI